jgi:hypothetical protein
VISKSKEIIENKISRKVIYFHLSVDKAHSIAFSQHVLANKEMLDALSICCDDFVSADILLDNRSLLHNAISNDKFDEEKIDQFINKYFSLANISICSSEKLISMTNKQWELVKSSCARLEIDIILVPFVRDVGSFFVNLYKESIQFNREECSYPKFIENTEISYDDIKNVKHIIDIFDADSVRVLQYNESKIETHNNFLKLIGLDDSSFEKPLLSNDINRSLSDFELDLLRIINGISGSRFSREIIEILVKHVPSPAFDNDENLKIAQILNERYSADVGWLNEIFYSDENFFRISEKTVKLIGDENISEKYKSSVIDEILDWCKMKNISLGINYNCPVDQETAIRIKSAATGNEKIFGEIFDKNFYLKENLDVANAGVDPLDHYMQFGFLEGRLPFANVIQSIDFALRVVQKERTEFQDKILQTCNQSESYLLELIEREKYFSQKIKDNEKNNIEKLNSLTQKMITREKMLFSKLKVAEDRFSEYAVKLKEQEIANKNEISILSNSFREAEGKYIREISDAECQHLEELEAIQKKCQSQSEEKKCLEQLFQKRQQEYESINFDLEYKLKYIQSSYSWRITKPFRYFLSLFIK